MILVRSSLGSKAERNLRWCAGTQIGRRRDQRGARGSHQSRRRTGSGLAGWGTVKFPFSPRLLQKASVIRGPRIRARAPAAAAGRPGLVFLGAGHWPALQTGRQTGDFGCPAVTLLGCNWDCHFENAPCAKRSPSPTSSVAWTSSWPGSAENRRRRRAQNLSAESIRLIQAVTCSEVLRSVRRSVTRS